MFGSEEDMHCLLRTPDGQGTENIVVDYGDSTLFTVKHTSRSLRQSFVRLWLQERNTNFKNIFV